MQTVEDVRAFALEKALEYHIRYNTGASSEFVVNTAENFYEFLVKRSD